ncbi:hypothetical protein [Pseudoduganella violaceinigra]|uniref:hypothetical protein n=1 Tax=Pseudoduganella violaceinigra TaxID=246602 RepID=UPI00048213FC|nr:hypothetical protein [Pseudoduganella violaceinigra]
MDWPWSVTINRHMPSSRKAGDEQRLGMGLNGGIVFAAEDFAEDKARRDGRAICGGMAQGMSRGQ